MSTLYIFISRCKPFYQRYVFTYLYMYYVTDGQYLFTQTTGFLKISVSSEVSNLETDLQPTYTKIHVKAFTIPFTNKFRHYVYQHVFGSLGLQH